MKYRSLGHTGIRVSDIGFGAWGIGGVHNGAVSYGPVDDVQSLRALRHAFARGVTLYDTSDLYGHGHSEELIGTAFRHERAQVVIATKAGFVNASGDQDFSPARLRRCLENSLRRLQTDYVDVYQLHNLPVDAINPGHPAIVELQAMQREGKIRAVGVSGRSPADALHAVDRLGIDAVQVNFNMIDQRAVEIGLFDRSRARGVGVICRTPLCYGFLTQKYAPADGRAFVPGDHRGSWPAEQIARWAGAPAVFEAIRRRAPQTPGQLALRFCLSYAGASSVIPGMLTVEQVDENIAASELGSLSDADRDDITRLYHRHEFFVARQSVPAYSAR